MSDLYTDNSNHTEQLCTLLRNAQLSFSEGNFASAALPANFSAQVFEAAKLERIGTAVDGPSATIIIASYRREANLANALLEVARQADEVRAEVILIDNGNEELLELAKLSLRSFTIITPPMQTGCSLARNIGALAARAEDIIFLDDDGLLGRDALRSLLTARAAGNAVAVRGRVIPLTDPSLTASHYDLGNTPSVSLITAEGISIWSRRVFLENGGFDPLLAGHEGLALSWKIWRFHGPHSMLYEPEAVLYHDFAPDKTRSEAKKLKHQRNAEYLALHAPKAAKLHETRLKHDNFLRETILNIPAPKSMHLQQSAVSVITTVRNGTRWIDDYTRCWKAQTFTDFQLVVVDDGSLDGTPDALAERWRDDKRLTLIRGAGAGRGASLNMALQHAAHDICLVADIDDISTPERIELTERHFTANPSCDWMSFVAYTEDNHYRIGFPTSLAIRDLSLRSLFGMPASFPTTAFRKLRFSQPFDTKLRAGVDCDWVRRNLLADATIKGELIQRPTTFYRIHDGQLSAAYKKDQEEARRALIAQSYSRILGSLGAEDLRWTDVLSNNLEITPEEKRALAKWIGGLLRQNAIRDAYDRDSLGLLMQDAFTRLRLKQPVAAGASIPANPAPTTPAKPPAPVSTSPASDLARRATAVSLPTSVQATAGSDRGTRSFLDVLRGR